MPKCKLCYMSQVDWQCPCLTRGECTYPYVEMNFSPPENDHGPRPIAS